MPRRTGGRPTALALILGTLAASVGPATAGWDDDPIRSFPPSPYPDRIILTWAGDPATSQAVTWRTDTTVTGARAQITPADASPDFPDKALEVGAVTAPLAAESGNALYHSVCFAGLEPRALYLYRVGSDQAWSEWFQFRTASDKPEPFTFLYFGDVQLGILSHAARTLRAAILRAPEARFMVFAGDLVSYANHDGQWGEWFACGGWVHAMIPTLPTPGNHEYWRDEQKVWRFSRHWRPQFTLPENGPAGQEETAYFIDYQGLRAVSLNSYTALEEQARWLDQVLARDPQHWTVVTFHYPIYSAARGRDNEELRRLWKPVFDSHGVDLVLQGHDHAYARGRNLPSLNQPGAVDGGPVYVVSVAGPKQYELTDDHWMDRAAENTQLFQVVTVTPDTLRYRAYTATDDLYDAFDLVKRPGARCLLIERTPSGVLERVHTSR